MNCSTISIPRYAMTGIVTLLLLLAAVPAPAQPSADEAFSGLVKDYEAWQAEQNPIRAGRRGDLEAAARWPDASPAAVKARRETEQTFLDRLEKIDADALTGNNPVSYAVLDYVLSSDVAMAQFDPERIPFVNDSGFFSMPLGVASSTRPRTIEQARAWLSRLDSLPAFLAQHREWMARGVADGFVQPAYVVEAVIGQIEAIVETPTAESPLLDPFEALPAALEAAHGEALRTRATEIVEARVRPAYRGLMEFFRTEYLANP